MTTARDKAMAIVHNLNDRAGIYIDFDDDIMEEIYQEIIDVIELAEENEKRLSKISILKSLVGSPLPTDDEWSKDFQAGVQHGFKMYESKLKFQIARLKKLSAKEPKA